MILHYLSRNQCRTIFLSLYVDEIIITSDDFDGIESLKTTLSYCFAMKDLGVLHYFLGLRLLLLQKVIFCLNPSILLTYLSSRLIDNKIVDTSLKTSVQYSPSDGIPLTNSTL